MFTEEDQSEDRKEDGYWRYNWMDGAED